MLQIRQYQESDFSALCALFLRAVNELACADYSPAQLAAWGQIDDARWRQKMATSLVLVAVIDDCPAGFVSAIGNDIDLLFVSPDYARRGVASMLLRELLARLSPGVVCVEASITARPCFERHGFKVVAEQRVAVRAERLINYRMEKRRRAVGEGIPAA